MKQNDTSSKEPISELGKALAGAMFWITVGTTLMRYGKFIFNLLGDIMILAWLILITAGIWSKDLFLLQIAGTILMAGLILYALTKIAFRVRDFYYPKKKPEPKPDPKANISEGMGDLMLQTFLIEKMKADPAFHKEVIARMTARTEELMGGTFQRKQEEPAPDPHPELRKLFGAPLSETHTFDEKHGLANKETGEKVLLGERKIPTLISIGKDDGIKITEVEAGKEHPIEIYDGFEIDYYPHSKRYFPRYHKRYLFYWNTKKVYTLQDEIAMAVFSETREEAIKHIKLYIELSKGVGVKTDKINKDELTENN
jgi:hypothetical protein